MKILASNEDKRINSTNILIESTIGEYLALAENILKNNDLQRRRVRTSKTTYSLLKKDLISGCVMPALVLAYTGENSVETTIGSDIFQSMMANNEHIIILDGLQRTYTMLDAREEVSKEKEAKFLQFPVRIELYVNINKFGVLYRMLTLNTGQTPMSIRHQLEMLYSDLLNTEIAGVKLIPEKDGKADPNENEFAFKNAIEGFNSYISQDPMPMDRTDILENIKMLENITDEAVDRDLFKDFLELYFGLFNTLKNISNGAVITKEELEERGITSIIIGDRVSKIFSTSQAMTSFGAAIGIMKEREVVSSFNDVMETIEALEEKYREGNSAWMVDLVETISNISKKAKKIGNDQRLFFVYFYRELLNKESDSYLDLAGAVKTGYRKYLSQV